MMDILSLALLAFAVAILYSSVGHGGASGYLAVMALAGMAPAQMKPTALVLNLLVAGLGSFRYIRAQCFRWSTFWPFAAGSVVFAFVGGASGTTDLIYKRLLAVALVAAAIALLVPRKEAETPKSVPIWLGILIGCAIGFVSGLIGVGGGIFLSPVLILAGWATVRETLGISSLFIFVNSAAGLLGHVSSARDLPKVTVYLAVAAFLGGLIGSELGSKRLPPSWVRWLLAAVLLTATLKLFFA